MTVYGLGSPKLGMTDP